MRRYVPPKCEPPPAWLLGFRFWFKNRVTWRTDLSWEAGASQAWEACYKNEVQPLLDEIEGYVEAMI